MAQVREVTRRFVLQAGFSCNARCRFCYYRESLEKGIVKDDTTEQVKAKLRHGRRLGKDQVDLSGGEPTIRKDICEIISYARKIGYKKVCIITNGLRTYDKKFADKLIKAGLNDVLLSLHSPIEKEHDWLTQVPGSWKKVMQSLKNFSKSSVECRVNSTITDVNIKHVELFFKLIKPYKPHAYNLLILNPSQESEVKEGDAQRIKDYAIIGKHISAAIKKHKKDFNIINIRWLPFCMVPGLEEHIRTRWQKLYEDQEWDPYINIKHNKGILAVIASFIAGIPLYPFLAPHYGKRSLYTIFNEILTTFRIALYHRHPKACKKCDLRKICTALPRDYVKKFNTTKLVPYNLGKTINDTLYFCKGYKKQFRSLRLSKS